MAETTDERAGYFLMSGNDDREGVWENMSIEPSRWHSFFTMPMAMAFINSVIGGTAVAIAIGIATGATLGIAVASAAVLAVIAFALQHRYNERMFARATVGAAMFPTPG